MPSVTDLLKMTKEALLNESAELDRCNYRYERNMKEIREIDTLIFQMERTEARRKSTYEKWLRTCKRNREHEIRRRVYLGLRMDPISSGHRHGLVHTWSNLIRRKAWQERHWTEKRS